MEIVGNAEFPTLVISTWLFSQKLERDPSCGPLNIGFYFRNLSSIYPAAIKHRVPWELLPLWQLDFRWRGVRRSPIERLCVAWEKIEPGTEYRGEEKWWRCGKCILDTFIKYANFCPCSSGSSMGVRVFSFVFDCIVHINKFM